MSQALVEFAKQFSQWHHHEMDKKNREQALEQAIQQGWPTIKHESWKYTSTRVLQDKHFLIAKTPAVIEVPIFDHEYTLYFIDGFFSPDHSYFPLSVELTPLTEAIKHNELPERFYQAHIQDSIFNLLNHALWQSGILLKFSKKTRLDKTLRIIFLNTKPNQAQHLKLALHLAEDAHAQIIFDTKSLVSENNLVNLMISTELSYGAKLNLLSVHKMNPNGFYYIHHHLNQKAQSHFLHASQTTTPQWFRHELNAYLQGPHGSTELLGTYQGENTSHIDHHVSIFHEADHCHSHQYFKGVLQDHARAVFNGKIFVAPYAQKTVARQKNDTILLDPHVEIDTKPELEIYADDVICSHGATVGSLDEEALFYLMSRGLNEHFAKQLLLASFLSNVFNSKTLANERTVNELFGE